MDYVLCGGDEETARHFVMECRELQEIRRRYGVYGTEALEEVLMFMEKSEAKKMSTDARKCSKRCAGYRGGELSSYSNVR